MGCPNPLLHVYAITFHDFLSQSNTSALLRQPSSISRNSACNLTGTSGHKSHFFLPWNCGILYFTRLGSLLWKGNLSCFVLIEPSPSCKTGYPPLIFRARIYEKCLLVDQKFTFPNNFLLFKNVLHKTSWPIYTGSHDLLTQEVLSYLHR